MKKTTTVETNYTLRSLMEKNTNVTLSKLADAVEAPYAAIRAKSKQPIEGQVFDPTAINYEAIESYIMKRSPELNLQELDWAKLNEKTEKTTKVLKESTVDFSVGKTYYLRYFKSNWTIVYATETHVCLMVADGSSTQPKVMAKTTMVACGIKPERVETNESEEA